MKRITLHWTAGNNQASAYEKTRYHFLVEGNGNVVDGDQPPEVNRSPLKSDYLQHCGGMNSDNIGVSICGMKDAREKPFEHGSYPITTKAYMSAIVLVANLCDTYRIKVSRNTVFLHSEVLPFFGRGVYKWDVNWVPGMSAPGKPLDMGNAFRAAVSKELAKRQRGWWQQFIFWIRRVL